MAYVTNERDSDSGFTGENELPDEHWSLDDIAQWISDSPEAAANALEELYDLGTQAAYEAADGAVATVANTTGVSDATKATKEAAKEAVRTARTAQNAISNTAKATQDAIKDATDKIERGAQRAAQIGLLLLAAFVASRIL